MLARNLLTRCLLIITLMVLTTEYPLSAQTSRDLAGIWQGELNVGMPLRIVFHLSAAEDGSLSATLDSPDQGASGIAVSAASLEGKTLTLTVAAIGGQYKGELQSDGNHVDGSWSQGGQSFPLKIKRVEKLETRVRPQDPVPPFPYESEEVRYPNKAADIMLAGTLTIPAGNGPFPAVVMITGSGAQNRDEELMGHRPFLVIADYLSRNGIAVLRADDRGVGESGGDFQSATSKDFATDAHAGVRFLQSDARINALQIGLIGHSEGGLIAPMLASTSDDIAFIVLMAGPGISGEQILYLQKPLILKAMGASAALLKEVRIADESTFSIIKAEPDDQKAKERIREFSVAQWNAMSDALKEEAGRFNGGQSFEDAVEASLGFYLTPWFRFFLSYDPVPALEKTSCPVLAINGEKDLQVPPAENLSVIKRALDAGGNKNVRIEELSGLNHLFQTAESGAPGEYAQIEETISPKALDLISRWIRQQTNQ